MATYIALMSSGHSSYLSCLFLCSWKSTSIASLSSCTMCSIVDSISKMALYSEINSDSILDSNLWVSNTKTSDITWPPCVFQSLPKTYSTKTPPRCWQVEILMVWPSLSDWSESELISLKQRELRKWKRWWRTACASLGSWWSECRKRLLHR